MTDDHLQESATGSPPRATPSLQRKLWWGFALLFTLVATLIGLRNRGPVTEEALLLAALDARGPETWIEGWLREIGIRRFGHDQSASQIAKHIIERDGFRALPYLIGVIDADNSYESIYNIGYIHLRPLTGVSFSFFHDGDWWRRWWSANQDRYSAGVRAVPIPDLPKTRNGRAWKPFPADIDTLQGKLRVAPELVVEWRRSRTSAVPPRIMADFYGADVAAHRDPHAIPYLIALLAVGGGDDLSLRKALRHLTGVEHSADQSALWWRQWWADHRRDYAEDVAKIEIPELTGPWTFNWTETPDVIPDWTARGRRQPPMK